MKYSTHIFLTHAISLPNHLKYGIYSAELFFGEGLNSTFFIYHIMTYRPNLKEIERSYNEVRKNWQAIDDMLDNEKIGRKDTPFDKVLMENLLLAWDYIDFFIRKKDYSLLSRRGGPDMLEINNRVHYGVNDELRQEYHKAISATADKFSMQIKPMRNYYKKKRKNQASIYKIAAEIYISILGQPQLYIEGNHRSGSIVASWINLAHGKPPFVLTAENAVSFFRPAQQIKQFDKSSRWQSLTKLPKYKKSFKEFWVSHCDVRFTLK